MAAAPSSAEAFRRLGDTGAADGSPLHARVALAISTSGPALAALDRLPARRRQPALVLAALHDLALAGRAPALSRAYADPDAAAAAAVATLVDATDAVAGLVASRRLRTIDAQRCAVLQPAVAEAARRAGADAVGLVDLAATGLDLHLDRVGTTYADGSRLGDPASPVQLTCRTVGERTVPGRALPEVVARVRVDPDPVDVADPDEVRWLHACLAPDQPDRAARLAAELSVLAADPATLLRGDPLALLPDALARVPVDALPVVVTAWALSAYAPVDRLRLLQRLDAEGARRPVAWVSVEGVGVAPGVPTFGDRPASGHSVVGVALLRHTSLEVEAVGRCWSRGAVLAWLAGQA